MDVGLIVGFLVVDLFFFHDVFKAGESTSLPQYMTGFLSVAAFAICIQSLVKSGRQTPVSQGQSRTSAQASSAARHTM